MTYYRFVTRLTQQVPLVEQELLILPENLSSTPVLSRVNVQFTDCDYPVGIFKLFISLF